MDIKDINIDVGAELDVVLSDWKPDYKVLQKLGALRRRTVANAAEMWELIQDVATAVRLPKEVVAVVLHFEYDFPARSIYRASATRDDGSPTYRGVTQASLPFWIDVTSHAQTKGYKIVARRPESATLFEQIAAPFIYLDRYRSRVSDHLFTPAMIYALHQQGPGAASKGFANVAGNQSGPSLRAVRAAQYGAKGRRVETWL